jgi:hypothetical protein
MEDSQNKLNTSENLPADRLIYSIACKENILVQNIVKQQKKIKSILEQLKEKADTKPADAINCLIAENQKFEAVLRNIESQEARFLSELLESPDMLRD